jgi:TetR/AcrR family transcriptional regulator, regulator of cefoperazone and chloramphenicol sensitivity
MALSEGVPAEYSGPFMSEWMTTRDRLLDAATALLAERGVDNVSVAEIVRTAHQRNASAVRYHIGSRTDVLYAVLEPHVPVIAAHRRALLAQVRGGPPDDRMAATAVIVRPLADFARRGWRERAYLRIGSELSGMLDRVTPEIRSLMRETAGYEAWELLRQRCPEVPDDLWRIRCELCIVFVGQAVADWARLLDESASEHGALPDDRFVDNLIVMVLGAMTAIATPS